MPTQQQTYAPAPVYGPPPSYGNPSYGNPSFGNPSFGNPIGSALAWKAGLANNFASGIGGFGGSVGFGGQAPTPSYAYGAPPPVPAAQIAVPNKPVYVVCDQQH